VRRLHPFAVTGAQPPLPPTCSARCARIYACIGA